MSDTGLAVAPARPRRLVYLGTPELAVGPLRALVAEGFEVVLVVTRVDKRRGRGLETTPSPVKRAALDLALPVSHDLGDAVTVGADLGVVVAFGRIIGRSILEQLPMVNLHFSALPRWRGAAPVERAILAGDEATAVDLMQVAEGLDSGGVFGRIDVPINPTATLSTLRAELVERGTELLIGSLRDGLAVPVAQSGVVTVAAKITADDLHIDWDAPAIQIGRVVRLESAWTTWRGKRIKILSGVVDGDRFRPTSVQPDGKPPMSFDDWHRGARGAPGEWFT